MLVAAFGLNHRSAPVELRERVAFPPCASRSFLRNLREEGLVEEGVLLSTCNRTELYAVVEDGGARDILLDRLSADRGVGREVLERGTYWLVDEEAVRHLFRVAASLDSMVVGEGQILGQVREAYRAATEEKCTGTVLNRLFHTSLRVGKEVRAETGIGDSSISVPHVAVKLAREVFGSLAGRRALVVGAGEMSELVIKHLGSRGVGEVRISNRNPERARLLAERVGGRAVGFEELESELPEVDVVVSSTGSGEWIVSREVVERVFREREEPLFFVDIAVPRDVEPAVQSLDGAHVYDVDDLQDVVDRNAGSRDSAADAGEAMIWPAVFELMSWLSTLDVVPRIQELRGEAERVRHHELSRALKRMDLSPEEEETLERMSHSLVNKLLHGPIQDIKARAESPPEDEKIRRRMLGLDGVDVELDRPQKNV